MKKIIALLLVLTLTITAFAGCGKKGTELSGTTAEILAQINEKVEIKVMTMDKSVLEGGLPTYGFSDLTEDEFKKLVLEGDYTANAISSMYHHIIVLRFENSSNAVEFKDKIATEIKEFPYVCGNPEAYYVNDSDNYVFIAVTFADYVDKYAKAFEELAGTFGKGISGEIE